jgi:lysophospholipase L1-like esterase
MTTSVFGKLWRVPVLWVSLLLPLLLLASCSKTPQIGRIPTDGVVLAFGDSITFGTGASTAESYPVILEQLVGRKVINAGVPGEVTASGKERLAKLLEQERPALLLLCHGGNDLLQRLDKDQTRDNLRSMVRMALDKGISVVLIGVPAPDLSLSPPKYYSELAEEFGLPYDGKSLPAILAKGGLKSDYIHPNGAGYRKLAEALTQLLTKAGAL